MQKHLDISATYDLMPYVSSPIDMVKYTEIDKLLKYEKKLESKRLNTSQPYFVCRYPGVMLGLTTVY